MHRSASFTVTVRDTTRPTLTLPGAITDEATSPAGKAITFTATADRRGDGFSDGDLHARIG